MKPNAIRLNKFISESGMCSRREADEHIEKGRVLINKKKAMIGDQVHVGDRVIVSGVALEPRKGDDIIFIALNKPVGIESTTEESVHNNIVRFVNHSKRIFPIGRLDKDSQGLIFLTNNGDLVNKILRAGNHHEKEYIVTVNKPLSQTVISSMANGVPMLGIMTKKCKVELITPNTFRIILIQGLNRQIRRMCEHFGYEVNKLERIRIMNIGLKGLPIGDWRDLTKSEMDIIDKLLSTSSGDSKKKIMPASSQKTSYPPKHKSTAKSHKSSNASKFSQGKKTVRRGKK
ncbi:pseudouridine synthase [Chlorobiota bacterium]|nr:pseudouridine synthase [Chlorobiota bacterium]